MLLFPRLRSLSLIALILTLSAGVLSGCARDSNGRDIGLLRPVARDVTPRLPLPQPLPRQQVAPQANQQPFTPYAGQAFPYPGVTPYPVPGIAQQQFQPGGQNAATLALQNQGFAGGQYVGGAGFTTQQTQGLQPSAVAGSGQRIGMILPLGAGGEIGRVAKAMRNAALLAQQEIGGGLQLSFYDSKGNPSGAAQAAGQARQEGSAIILGPLLGSNISAVTSQSSGVPVLSFSNDQRQAGAGAYLLGIAPDASVARVVRYAAQRGLRRIAVLYPQNAYGQAGLQAAQNAAAQSGAAIVTARSYPAATGSSGKSELAKSLADQAGQFDAILIADELRGAQEISSLLLFNKVDLTRLRLLGTDRWQQGAGSEAALRGAWFAATAGGDRAAFDQRFRSRFGGDAPFTAGLAYDAVKLARQVLSSGGRIEGQSYSGLDGTVRFSGGRTIRDLAVFEVQRGGARQVDAGSGGGLVASGGF